MTLQVLDDRCQVNETSGVIIVASDLKGADAIVELESPETRKMALTKAAALGLSSPGVNGNVQIVPVSANGGVLETPGQEPARYQAEVPVTRKLL